MPYYSSILPSVFFNGAPCALIAKTYHCNLYLGQVTWTHPTHPTIKTWKERGWYHHYEWVTSPISTQCAFMWSNLFTHSSYLLSLLPRSWGKSLGWVGRSLQVPCGSTVVFFLWDHRVGSYRWGHPSKLTHFWVHVIIGWMIPRGSTPSIFWTCPRDCPNDGHVSCLFGKEWWKGPCKLPLQPLYEEYTLPVHNIICKT